MAEVEISYKGSNIATMNASGTKTLLTEGKYLEDDVTVTYTRPAAPSGTKNISITANGTTTEDVTNYANAEITANVPNTYSAGDEGKVVSNGALVAQGSDTVTTNDTYDTTLISSLIVNVSGGGGGDTLEWYCSRSVSTFTSFSGMYSGKNFTVDFKNYVGSLGGYNYMGMIDGPNGKLTFKGLSSSLTGANMNTTDFLRNSPCFQEIDFGGLAPATMTRWFRDWGLRTQDNKYASTPVTITNLSLDNLSSNNDSFSVSNTSDRYYRQFDVYFTGTLKNNITLSGWGKLNAASWNRLIECLYDYSEGTAHTLTVGSTILGMIDATHQALAAARGWTLA